MPRALLVAVALSAAACSTPYQPSGWTGGFAQEKLASGEWRVTFRGNANRDATFVMNAAMYRAAEIAKSEGQPFFEVVQPGTTVISRAYVNFTNLVSWEAALRTRGLRAFGEGCPPAQARPCTVYETEEALADYGEAIGLDPD